MTNNSSYSSRLEAHTVAAAHRMSQRKLRRTRENTSTPVRAESVKLDEHGNITAIDPVIGLRCFADPVRYLQHSLDNIEVRGEIRKTKCERCHAMEACDAVIMGRIERDPELKRLYDLWFVLSEADSMVHRFGPEWWTFEAAWRSRRWTSANDRHIEEHRAKQRTAKRERDKKSAKAKRARQPKSPKISVASAELVTAVLNRQSALLHRLLTHTSRPRWLSTTKQCQRASSVWAAAEINEASGDGLSPNKAVHRLRELNLVWSDNAATLLTEVKRLMKRLDELRSM